MADKLEVVITAKDDASGTFKKIGGGLSGIMKIASGFIIGDFISGALKSAIGLFPDMIGKASDLNETLSKTQIVFGDLGDAVITWSENSATAMGMTQNEALAAASTYGNLFRAMGITEESSYDMSTGLVELASDLASFNNMEPTVVLDKLRAGLTGETEPLKTLGVNLNQATIEAKAMELGLYDGEGALSAAAKAQASYALILEQTTLAQGDFARTSEGLANQQRILKANLDNVKTSIGAALLPVVNTFVSMINDFVSSEQFTAFLTNLQGVLAGVAEWIGNAIPVALNFLSSIWTNVLQPAIAAVWTFLSTVVIPFFQNQVVPWLQEYIPKAVQFLSDIWTNVLQPAIQQVWNWINTTLIPFFSGTVQPWLEEYIPQAIQILSDFWTDNLLPAIQMVWDWLMGSLVPFLVNTIVPILKILIPAAIKILSFAWESILQPAIAFVWDFLSNTVMPFLSNTVFPFIQENLPKAIQVLSDFWTNVLQPAIKVVFDWLFGTLLPFLRDTLVGVFEFVGDALTTLAAFWTDTLKPAIEAVWSFITDSVIPIFETLIETLGTVLAEVIGTLSDLWTDTLQPALEAVWSFITDSVYPIFEDLGKLISGAFQTAVETISEVLDTLSGIFDAIGEAISNVIDWVQDFIDKLKAIHLPDWLTPGSPTPFELGLRGIAGAMKELSTYSIPAMAGGLAGMGAGVNANETTNNQTNFYLSANYKYQSQEDVAKTIQTLAMLYGVS